MFQLPIGGNEPIILKNDHTIGHVDIVTVVDKEDAFWDEDETPMVGRVDPADLSVREKQRETQLDIGQHCSMEQKATLVQLLKQKQEAFALSNNEVGQTDIVEHSTEMDDSTPIRTSPRRLPYAL